MTLFWKWCATVAVFASLAVVACVTGRVAADRTSELKALATELAPFLPAPAGGVVELAAGATEAAVAAYLEQHPELLDQDLGLEDWLMIAGMALVGGQTRRSAVGGIASLAKSLVKSGGPKSPT